MEAVKKGEYDLNSGVWQEISDNAKNLVMNMLQLDPKARITADKALKHPWF